MITIPCLRRFILFLLKELIVLIISDFYSFSKTFCSENGQKNTLPVFEPAGLILFKVDSNDIVFQKQEFFTFLYRNVITYLHIPAAFFVSPGTWCDMHL